MQTEELKILLALEPLWTVSINGHEFLPIASKEIYLETAFIKFRKCSRRILDIQWLRPNIIRLKTRSRFRTPTETLTFYPGSTLPSGIDLLQRRRSFQRELTTALCSYFHTRAVSRQTLRSDKRHNIGGAYPRVLIGTAAVIAVHPDESTAVINGIVRAAIMWSKLIRRRITVVVPLRRRNTILMRLAAMPSLRSEFDWIQWDDERIAPLMLEPAESESYVHEFFEPMVQPEVDRIRALAPDLLQAVPHIAGRAVSIRCHGLEIARVTENGTTYPFGEPVESVINLLVRERRAGSNHALARAHQEGWLESKLIGQLHKLLPVRPDSIYPQVPSFSGGDRNVIDLLAITDDGRLVVIEVKASSDPELPFQAFDYWLAVEKHRKAGDFVARGYFRGQKIRDEAAVLVMVAPLLRYHRTLDTILKYFPATVPVLQIGINQDWKKGIKILRRKGLLGYAERGDQPCN